MDIAVTVGGSFLSSFLQVLFDRMARPEFLNLFRQQRYDGRILEKLNWNLLTLQTVLEDAENKQTKNQAVKRWLDELQELVYQADDLLDLINTETLRVKVESQYPCPTDQVSASADPSSFSIKFLKEIMPKLEEIVEKLEEFEKRIGILGLVKEVESKKQPSYPTSLVDEDDVYGRDADRDEIIQELLSNGANGGKFSVISIVGLGGIGKTTLAQYVYNDERLKGQFDVAAWVCISEEYDALRITKLLLDEVTKSVSDPNENNMNSLQQKLKEGLSKEKFLIVLDDVWNSDYGDWLELSKPLKYGKEGSSVIVTTRDERVALMMGARHIHHLNIMAKEDCRTLFEKHALTNRNLEFESIGKEILKKCRGLPLAVKAIAGLLRFEKTVEDWNRILRSEEWDQANNDKVLPSLRLSYTSLSSYLKRCFAYCAVFHKDYRFSKHEVILLWMANDLLQDPRSKKKRLEDIGEEFFHELRFRSFFEQSGNGKFSMHDLVNDLAKFVSGKYFVRLEDHWQCNSSSSAVRHFSYPSSDFDLFEKFKPLNESKFLRTFLPLDFHGIGYIGQNELSHKLLVDVIPAFQLLRVLSLCGYNIKELPNVFSNLKQLRFLNLSRTCIKKLPSWVCTFCNLQTLLLANCLYLREFPEDMEKLINLRHLDLCGVKLTKIPMEIERLEKLQFLSTGTFVVSKDSDPRIEKLGKLHNLHGKFTISGLENIANGKSASMAKMKCKKYIKKLNLEWSGDVDNSLVVQDVLKNLQPQLEIEHVEIRGYPGTCFTSWLRDSSFCKMVSLCIYDCENCFCLPAIGQLPSLKYLRIRGLSKVLQMGEEFYGKTEPFPCLKELTIENMREWREWYVPENGVFSSLEVICVDNCPNLIGKIPKKLPSLRALVIWGCPGLVNAEGGLTIFDSLEADSPTQFCSLGKLSIWEIPNLKKLASSSSDLNQILPRLVELSIEDCQQIGSFPINHLPATLKQLNIHRCGHLELETNEMTCHVSIQQLEITDSSIIKKNISLDSFPKLQHLHICRLRSFEEMSINPFHGNQNLTPLQSLSIDDCEDFMSFPVGGIPAPNLTQITLWSCPKLKSLPERMHALLQSLRELSLWNCPEIECFPEGGLPSSLKNLSIQKCERLWSCRGEWGLQRLPSLVHFTFSFTHKEETLLLEEMLLPSTLRSLSLGSHHDLKMLNLQDITGLQSLSISFCPKLRSLSAKGLPVSLSSLSISDCSELRSLAEEGLPVSLSNLVISDCSGLLSLPEEVLSASLSKLVITNCPNLQSLPKMGLPASLSELSIASCPNLQSLPKLGLPDSLSKLVIYNCPLLKLRLELEKGEDWPKVAHIPCIKVNDELFP